MDDEPELSTWHLRRHAIFTFLNDGASSRNAQRWAMWILICTTISVLNIVLESVESIRTWGKENNNFFFIVETIVVVFFILDYFGRLFTCPRLKDFVFDFLNFIDILAIVPWVIEVVLMAVGTVNSSNVEGLASLRVVRLIRIVRLIKLGKSSLLFRLFISAMAKGRDGVVFLVFIMAILTVFYSTLVFYAETASCDLIDGIWIYVEGDDAGLESYFQNIPLSFWWCIVTLTTVGYGDTYPRTDWGRVVASMTMVSAIVVLAFPVTILGHAFGEAAAEYNIEKRMLSKRLTTNKIDTSGDLPEEQETSDQSLMSAEEAKVDQFLKLEIDAEEFRAKIAEMTAQLEDVEKAQKMLITQLAKDLMVKRESRALRIKLSHSGSPNARSTRPMSSLRSSDLTESTPRTTTSSRGRSFFGRLKWSATSTSNSSTNKKTFLPIRDKRSMVNIGENSSHIKLHSNTNGLSVYSCKKNGGNGLDLGMRASWSGGTHLRREWSGDDGIVSERERDSEKRRVLTKTTDKTSRKQMSTLSVGFPINGGSMDVKNTNSHSVESAVERQSDNIPVNGHHESTDSIYHVSDSNRTYDIDNRSQSFELLQTTNEDVHVGVNMDEPVAEGDLSSRGRSMYEYASRENDKDTPAYV
eukprot:CFRG6505T1